MCLSLTVSEINGGANSETEIATKDGGLMSAHFGLTFYLFTATAVDVGVATCKLSKPRLETEQSYANMLKLLRCTLRISEINVSCERGFCRWMPLFGKREIRRTWIKNTQRFLKRTEEILSGGGEKNKYAHPHLRKLTRQVYARISHTVALNVSLR